MAPVSRQQSDNKIQACIKIEQPTCEFEEIM